MSDEVTIDQFDLDLGRVFANLIGLTQQLGHHSLAATMDYIHPAEPPFDDGPAAIPWIVKTMILGDFDAIDAAMPTLRSALAARAGVTATANIYRHRGE